MEKRQNRGYWVYDIETLKGCFTYTGYNIDTEEVVQYIIHKDNNQIKAIRAHLTTCKAQIGFNNLNFDYPIIHFILKSYKDNILADIYNKSQELIFNNKPFGNSIRNKEVLIRQVDLFRMWHFNNAARSQSLKGLEVAMNFPNVMDMPIHHNKEDITENDIKQILLYNLNDVMATYEFYKETIKYDKIALRNSIITKYNLPCINWNNGKIGEELILKLYCDKTGKNPYEVRKLRSKREIINLIDCIPNGIKYSTKAFNSVLEAFKVKSIKPLEVKENKSKNSNNRIISILIGNCKIDYGLGGVHGVCEPGLYCSNDEYIIKSMDISSLYPWLPIVYRFYIEHLGPEFLEVYEDNIVNVRLQEKLKPKDQQDKAIIDGFKESANIPYGKSNDENSFLYDPLYTFKTTVAGQLVTSMLCERLCNIPNSKLLMYNTDGLEIMISRKYEELYNSICKEWEKETKLTLEFADYQKIWIGDINNYGCLSITNKIKNKGRFEVDKKIGNEPAYHKDNSFRVVPLAIEAYFKDNIPVEQTIRNHTNIYDFCGRQKFKGEDYGLINYLRDNEIIREKQQKIIRYYISNKGGILTKIYSDNSKEFIHKGYNITIFNQFIEKDIKDYDIDYQFYIMECNKELNIIINKQMKMTFD